MTDFVGEHRGHSVGVVTIKVMYDWDILDSGSCHGLAPGAGCILAREEVKSNSKSEI